MPLQCVVLAGGLGTRMRRLTGDRPKALVPVLGRPFADWQLRQLASLGVERVTYCVGFGGEQLREYVGDGRQFGLAVSWVSEGAQLKGTGGALRLAVEAGVMEEAAFVLYGDSYLRVDMMAVERAWGESGLPALMTVLRNEGRWDSSNAIYANRLVTLYDKSRPAAEQSRMHWIDYGLSILSRELVASRIPKDTVFDLAELLRGLSQDGRLAGFEVQERFYEIGSPQGLADLEAYLSSRP